MSIEDYEINDWGIQPQDDGDTRKQKSIQAYYLDRWYDKISTITYKTIIYNSIDDVPDILPFDKCMVRWENKSPKDSELWGPVNTKSQMIKLFNTSLTCVSARVIRGVDTSHRKYCVREWDDGLDPLCEYRCFWNEGLVAVSTSNSEQTFGQHDEVCTEIANYIELIQNAIPYHRCVFDIAKTTYGTLGYVLIEFNSWRTNSGAHYFDWNGDDFLHMNYDNKKEHIVVFRSSCNEIHHVCPQISYPMCINVVGLPVNSSLEVINNIEHKNCCWVLCDDSVYVSNDVWMCHIPLLNGALQPINRWTHADESRFYGISLISDNAKSVSSYFQSKIVLKCGNVFKTGHFTNVASSSCNIPTTQYIVNNCKFRYGFPCKQDGKLAFARLLYDGTIVIHYIDEP